MRSQASPGRAPNFIIFGEGPAKSFWPQTQHLTAPMLLCDQQQSLIVAGGAAATTAGFAFNVEDQIHGRSAPLRVFTKALFAEACLHVRPLSVERLQSRITGSRRCSTHARVQPRAGRLEIAQDCTITL